MKLKRPRFSLRRKVEPRSTLSPFRPHRLIRSGRLQTLASAYPVRRLANMLAGEQMVILDAGPDFTGHDEVVRLMGYYNRHETDGESQGLIISLHGWEGNSHSPYSLLTGRRFLAEGYDLFRLNLRDHGPRLPLKPDIKPDIEPYIDPYSLNQGLFLGTLIEEALSAVQQVAAWAKDVPVYLVGPSLGGNFVLRMALLHATHPIANLRRVIAINPAINPSCSTDRIDRQYPFRRFFRSRWLRSVLAKEQHFPHLYDFSPLVNMSRVRPMTEWLVQHYTAFEDAEDYFSRYSVLGDALVGLTIPTTILTAADDPVVLVEDFEALTIPPMLDLKIEPFGGHVGFVDLWPLRHLLPEMILAELQRE